MASPGATTGGGLACIGGSPMITTSPMSFDSFLLGLLKQLPMVAPWWPIHALTKSRTHHTKWPPRDSGKSVESWAGVAPFLHFVQSLGNCTFSPFPIHIHTPLGIDTDTQVSRDHRFGEILALSLTFHPYFPTFFTHRKNKQHRESNTTKHGGQSEVSYKWGTFAV